MNRVVNNGYQLLKQPNRCALAVAFSLLLTLGACGDEPADNKAENEEQAPTGQVIARVNGQEITIHELGAELARINLPENADRGAVERRVFQALVERIIFEQKAKESQMDRLPGILLNLRRSKSAILAQAYLSDRLATRGSVGRQEAEAYVQTSPSKFADREYFVFDAVAVSTVDVPSEMHDELEALGTLDAVENRLRQLGMQHRRVPQTAHSDQLAQAMLDQMDELESTGKIFFMVGGAGTLISRVQTRRPAVLTGEDALRAATNFLERKGFQDALAELRSNSISSVKVEFLGNYSDMTMEDGSEVDDEIAEQIDEAVQSIGETATETDLLRENEESDAD